jgi:hypothetical protein
MSIYYESSWAILSTIGIGNVLFGWIITGIAGLSASSLIPIVTSAAGAIANGLCYHVYYEDPAPAPASATGASVVADVMWLVGFFSADWERGDTCTRVADAGTTSL